MLCFVRESEKTERVISKMKNIYNHIMVKCPIFERIANNMHHIIHGIVTYVIPRNGTFLTLDMGMHENY